jgi:integrase
MASVQERNGKHQLRVKHRLLVKPYHQTFDTDAEARSYGYKLEAMLASGVVPIDMLAVEPRGIDPTIVSLIKDYRERAPITDSDNVLLNAVEPEVKALRVSGVTFLWAETYVKDLKLVKNLAPGSIRKRVGVLARILDWHFRRSAVNGQVPGNALRLLPIGYSQYNQIDESALGKGKVAKVDVKRDLRLPPEDEARVRLALSGVKRKDRERGLTPDAEFTLLFDLIIDTGLRLSEAYRLRIAQIDFAMGVIAVEGSKGARGRLKPRTVPMKKELREKLKKWCTDRVGLVFSFWDGTKEGRARATSKLSVRFGNLFDYAGVERLTEHDLRHEACCRWVTLRGSDGRWVFSDTEICKIMGWTSADMMLRYASLRGEDLANRLL